VSSNPQSLHAVLALPAGLQRAVADVDLRRWLSRGSLSLWDRPTELLHRVLEEIGLNAAGAGLAALRLWGQTGERASTWMMAADPVHLQTRLDHLRVHALARQLQLADLRPLFDSLQSGVGGAEYAFARIGDCGYLRGEQPVACSGVSADTVDGLPPDEFMPSGQGSESYHRLLGEVQMFLHDHPVNESRSALGLPAINSLWFWGGGIAPEPDRTRIYPLFADDPLFRGYWLSKAGRIGNWIDDFSKMAGSSTGGFVAVMPAGCGAGAFQQRLLQLRYLVKCNSIGRATLVFADGLRIDLRRSDRLKFLRPPSPLLEPI